jgi:hypothetical protein
MKGRVQARCRTPTGWRGHAATAAGTRLLMEAPVAKKRQLRRVATTLLALVLMTLGSVVVAGAPAQAVPGFFEVSASSATDSTTFRQVTAACPAGTKVYGEQATIVTSNGNLALDGVVPSGDLQTVTAFATEIVNYTRLWRLVVHAVCGPPVATCSGSGRSRPPPTRTPPSSRPRPAPPVFGVDLTAGFGSVVLTAMTAGNPSGLVIASELFGSFTAPGRRSPTGSAERRPRTFS